MMGRNHDRGRESKRACKLEVGKTKASTVAVERKARSQGPASSGRQAGRQNASSEQVQLVGPR